MDGHGVNLTIKADGAAPWLTISADSPAELELAVSKVGSRLLTNAAELGSHFTAAYRVAQGFTQPSAPPQDTPPPAAQPSATERAATVWNQPPGNPVPQPSGPQNGQPHPNGDRCPLCGQTKVYKEITTSRGLWKMWTCPNQRAKNDGHAQDTIR